MDQKRLFEIEARCTQESPPRCQNACPFRMDVRAFLIHLTAGKTGEARKVLERHVPLPEIMARICDHPCENACLRRGLGGGLAVGDLERFCVANSNVVKMPPRPSKAGQVSVLGNGLAALTVAWDLSRKGFAVTVFHEGEPEAGLVRRYAPLKGFLKSFFKGTIEESGLRGVTFAREVLNQEFAQRVRERGVVFVDADSCPTLAPERTAVDAVTLMHDGVCFGGWLSRTPTGHEYASASNQAGSGRRAALTMQRMLEGVSLTAVRGDEVSEDRLHVPREGINPVARVVPGEQGYTDAEAAEEAARCVRCQCLACVKECVFLQKYKGFPRTYARQIYNNMSIVKGQHLANRLVTGCALCGQCTELCPERFSMAELCIAARQDMVERAYMPPSAHEFALGDMADADTTAFTLHARGHNEKSAGAPAFALFPGCQLPASRPEQVAALYAFMKPLWRDNGELGLLQACCGVPAYWAGRHALFQEHSRVVREQWTALGRPRLLMACASCLKTFRDFFSDIPAAGLWEALDGIDAGCLPLLSDVSSAVPKHLTVHDPCAARHDAAWQNAVRSLAVKRGVRLEEPRLTAKTTACCGFGGLVWNAQPDQAEAMTVQRARHLGAGEGKAALTSCVMCRDRLSVSMPAVHVLDLLFPPVGPEQGVAGLSARRANRARFKALLCGGVLESGEAALRIADDVLAAMERRFILRSDVDVAVRGVEAAGTYFTETESGHRVGAWRPGNVTFWVRYSADGSTYVLHDAWCHRMKVPGASLPNE